MNSGVGNLDDFLQSVDQDVAALSAAVLAETRTAASAGLVTAVEGTPVQTGLHRGSWTVGVGAEAAASGNPLDPSGAATIAAGEFVIAGAKHGQTIIIQNDGPAIELLDEGRSTQAPAGFSLRAAQAAAGQS